MRSTTPALRAAALAPPAPSGTPPCSSIRSCPPCWTACTSHTLCEQNADALAETLPAVEAAFGDLLPRMKWLNFGGGHHITRPDYDLPLLEKCITGMQAKYGVQVYLEPGEAWALNAGYLVTTVLDTLQNGDTSLAILDLSAACHTPDVIEMPYRPPLLDAGEPGEKPCTVRLGGPTCLAGDVIGDYSFAAPPHRGAAAHLWRYGHLFHLQEQHLQRDAPAGHLAAVRGWDAPASGALWLRGFQVPSGEPRRQRPAHNIHPNLSGRSLPQKQGDLSGVWQEMSDGKDSLRSPVQQLQYCNK